MTRPARGRRRGSAVASLTMGLAIALGGCTEASGTFSGPPPRRAGPAVTYVALGEQLQPRATDPRLLWQDVFRRAALPYWATTYLVEVEGSWQVDPEAVVRQVSALNPTVISVDVGFEEASAGEDAAEFSASLRQLLEALETRHVPTILLANLPPAPAQPDSVPTRGEVADYDSAIAADSKAAGTVLVDIHDLLAHASVGGQALSSRGMLTTRGAAVVADAFAAAAKRRLPAAARGSGRT